MACHHWISTWACAGPAATAKAAAAMRDLNVMMSPGGGVGMKPRSLGSRCDKDVSGRCPKRNQSATGLRSA